VRKAAVFDIGSVSVKMIVAEEQAGGGFVPLLERARVTRLGEGLAGRTDFLPAAVDRTLEAVSEFAAEAAALGAEEMEALGTEALRRVADPGAFARELALRTGILLKVIEPGAEARLAFLSACALVPEREKPLCIVDVGGGSTEILSGEGGLPGARALLPIGALRLKEACCIATDSPGWAEISSMRKVVADLAERHSSGMACSRLVGMGGTIMVLASVLRGEPLFEPERLHGSTLSLEGARSVISLLSGLSPSERASVKGLPADRADLALPGAVIVEGVMTRLGVSGLLASAWGIRHGRMAELFKSA
jgi:exopolyphosphatase/guanosine-5'-triphosphate,3'-diphosphate pyrophosphatase